MPASDISRLSTPRIDTAATIAREITNLQIRNKLQSGELRRDDRAAFEREYKAIYTAEYYRYYNLLQDQAATSKIIYLPTDNPAAKKFYCRHTPVRFSRTNLLIRVQDKRVLIGRFEYPIDREISPETKEARISSWPGPLDRCHDDSKIRLGEYLDTLIEKDSRRRIRYCTNDEQRLTILKLLIEILNGRITAPVITRLLVRPEQAEIPDDDSYKRPLEILENHLLLGRPKDAIKFAKSKNLFMHSAYLTFINDYQEFFGSKLSYFDLKDGMHLQNYKDFIKSLTDHNILNIVYKSLMNKIFRNELDPRDIMKHNVGNNAYEFAILSANDCAMDFDQTNEIFKLVTSIKQAKLKPSIGNHLISLGFVTLDNYDNSEDSSFRSYTSFNGQHDTYAARTLKISNIDMLIINEIWEHCLNIARGTCDINNYDYILDLVPYKLIFATKLYDFGLYEMFADYLYSMQRALTKARQDGSLERDSFYDWGTIEQSVDHLAEIWRLHQGGDSNPSLTSRYQGQPLYQPPRSFDTIQDTNQMNPVAQMQQPIQNVNYQADILDSSPINDYPSLPYQDNLAPPMQNIPTQAFNRMTIGEETNPFDPEPLPPPDEADFNNASGQQHNFPNHHPNLQHPPPPPPQHFQNEPPIPYASDYSHESSRRPSVARSQSMDMPPVFSPPSFGPPGISERPIPKSMTTSSPVDRRDSLQEGGATSNYNMGESFNTPFSPINEYNNDLPPSGGPSNVSNNNEFNQGARHSTGANDNAASSSTGPTSATSKSASEQQQQSSAGDQQSGIFNIFGNILKKSTSSKQMVLPDDKNPDIVWDAEKKAWVNSKNPEGADSMSQNDAPPTANSSSNPQQNYSFGARSSKMRYPRGNF